MVSRSGSIRGMAVKATTNTAVRPGLSPRPSGIGMAQAGSPATVQVVTTSPGNDGRAPTLTSPISTTATPNR